VILVDTSVWVGHFRSSEPTLVDLLGRGLVLTHPFVIGELGLGNLRGRSIVLEALKQMPGVVKAHDNEVLAFIESHQLHGLGIGYVDAHLLVSAKLTPSSKLWTFDQRLGVAAAKLDIAFAPRA
jgi:predicted nucleic acid-binding protein